MVFMRLIAYVYFMNEAFVPHAIESLFDIKEDGYSMLFLVIV